MLAGNSIKSVSFNAGISDGNLYQWIRKYKIYGYNGLIDKKKGRKSKNPAMHITYTLSENTCFQNWVQSILSEQIGLTTVNWILVQLQTLLLIGIPIVFQPDNNSLSMVCSPLSVFLNRLFKILMFLTINRDNFSRRNIFLRF